MNNKRFLNALMFVVLGFFATAGFAQSSETSKDAESSIVEAMTAGKAQALAGQTDDAYSSFRNALAQSEQLFGQSSMEYAALSLEAGASLVDTEMAGKARKFLTDAHEYFSAQLGESALETALAGFYLGKYWMNEGRGKWMNDGYELRALPLLEASLPVIGKAGNYQAVTLMTHALIVQAYERMDRSDEATPHLLAIGNMIAAGYGDEFSEQPVYSVAPTYPICRGYSSTGSIPGCSVSPRPSQAEIEFDVNALGAVANVRVVSSEGDRNFTQAALTAFEQYRYAPRIVNGQAVNTKGLTIKFDTSGFQETLASN